MSPLTRCHRWVVYFTALHPLQPTDFKIPVWVFSVRRILMASLWCSVIHRIASPHFCGKFKPANQDRYPLHRVNGISFTTQNTFHQQVALLRLFSGPVRRYECRTTPNLDNSSPLAYLASG